MATFDREHVPSTRPEMNTGRWVPCHGVLCKDKDLVERGMHKPGEDCCAACYEHELYAFARAISAKKCKKAKLNPGEKLVATFEEAGFAWIAGIDGKLIQRELK